MSIDSDVIRGHVDTIILKTLTTGDKYGYEIIKEIEQKSQGTYELKQPTLYSCLKRLENQGLISGYSKNSDIGGKRHYYKLTKKGRESYENSMQDWFNSRSIIDNLMGTKPTTLTFADDDNENEESESPVSPEQLEDSLSTEQEPVLEENFINEQEPSNFEMENKEVAQMMIDESSSITQETEPRDFENVNLDDDDVALLGDYYKTDENQINLFGEDFDEDNANDENKEDNLVEDDDALVTNEEFSDDEPENSTPEEDESESFFKNYEGADVSRYRKNNNENYFDSISNYEPDENTSNFTPIIDETREDEEFSATENLSSSSGFSSFNYFGNYGQFDDKDEEESQNDENTEFDSEPTFNFPSSYVEESKPEEQDETLHFGFGGYEDEDSDEDNMDIPTSFSTLEDEMSDETEESYHAPISIFGEDSFKDHEEDEPTNNFEDESCDGPSYMEPEDTFNYYISNDAPTSDLKPYNIGSYSEPEHKEKLNQLSSYTKSNYETKPVISSEEIERIEAKSITDLKEDFDSIGINVRSYAKPEREPWKDKKYLLVNKIKFATSWIVFGIMSLLLLGAYLLANKVGYNDLTLVSTALPAYFYYLFAGLVVLAVPTTYTIIYLLNKTKKVKPNYNAIISLVFALLFFVVCLNIIYTFNILNGFTKFTQTDYNHLLWLLPSVVSSVIVFQSLVYSLLYKTKRFNA